MSIKTEDEISVLIVSRASARVSIFFVDFAGKA